MSQTLMSHWIRAGCVLVALLLGLDWYPVQAKRVLFAAMDDWPPFIIDRVSLSSDSGFDGIDRELLQELSVRSRRRDPSVALSVCPRATRSADGARRSHHQSGENPARSRFIGYLSTPYYQCHPTLYALPALAKQVRRYADLDGKTIGYVRGSAYFEPFDSDLRLHRMGC